MDASRKDNAPEGDRNRDRASAREVDLEPGPDDRDSSRSSAAPKERVLHTRVPAVLEAELKRFAENLRVPVSNLVRTILEDALQVADAASENVEARLKSAASKLGQEREKLRKRVQPDPLTDVFAFQPLTLAVPATCAKCNKEIKRGEQAHLGLVEGPPRPHRARLFVCDDCLPRE